jgi:hypothetical protein
MGHSSVTVTYDRYGHLMPGNEDEAAALLDAYLARMTSRVLVPAAPKRRSGKAVQTERRASPSLK